MQKRIKTKVKENRKTEQSNKGKCKKNKKAPKRYIKRAHRLKEIIKRKQMKRRDGKKSQTKRNKNKPL